MSDMRKEQQQHREQRIRELVAEGCQDWAIATRLGISRNTVSGVRHRLGLKRNSIGGDVWGVDA